MSRNLTLHFHQTTQNQGGLALFTLSESDLVGVGSSGFGLSWSDYEPDVHFDWTEAYKDVDFDNSIIATECSTKSFWDDIVVSLSPIGSAYITAVNARLWGSTQNITWTNATELQQTFVYSGTGLLSSIARTTANSSQTNITALVSGLFQLQGAAAIVMAHNGVQEDSITVDGFASDAYSPHNAVIGNSIIEAAAASEAYDGVFARPGVESTQFYAEIQTTSGTWTDLSDDVLRVNIYRQVGDLFRGIRPGEAIITLNNWDGKYTLDNEAHTYALRPNAQFRFISTYLANTVVMFSGESVAYTLNPDPDERDLTIRCKDSVEKLQRKTVTTSLFSDYQVGSFVADIMDDLGITTRSIDILDNTIPTAWFADRNGLNALEEIIEAGAYSAFVDGAGVFNFRRRNFELSEGSKLSADEFFGLEYRKDNERIFNSITVGGERRQVTTAVHTLTYIVEPVFVSDGSTKDFFLSYFDFQTRDPVPATGLVTPIASEDILVNESSSGTGADLTNQCSWWLDEFAEASKCYIYNGSGQDGYITKFQIRGQPARKEPTIERLREVSSSQAVYGKQEFVIDNKFIQDESYAGDYGDYLKQRFSDPRPRLGVRLRNENPEARALELGDLITVTNSYLGFVTTGFVIKEIEHDITMDRGILHDVEVRVERPSWGDDVIIFTLSDPIKGVLNGSGQLVF